MDPRVLEIAKRMVGGGVLTDQDVRRAQQMFRQQAQPRMSGVGGNFAGATLMRGPGGGEIQAGVGPAHMGAGFDLRRGSGGFDVGMNPVGNVGFDFQSPMLANAYNKGIADLALQLLSGGLLGAGGKAMRKVARKTGKKVRRK